MDELKKLLAALQTSFSAFKEKNNERLDQIEANGHADPLLEQTVDKINDRITELSDSIEKHKTTVERQKENMQRIDDLEVAMNRPNMGGAGGESQVIAARAASEFLTAVRKESVIANAEEIEMVNNYRPAFSHYLRRGDKGLSADVQAAMSVGSDPDGGYWVEPDTTGAIVTQVFETSPMRQYADVQAIGTDALEGINDLDEAGGGWVGETAAPAETDTPGVGKYRIPVHGMSAEPRATQQLLDDSMVSIESWLAGKVSSKFVRLENTAFVVGDGNVKPRGFLTYPAGTPSASAWDVIQQSGTGTSGAFDSSDPGDVFHTIIGTMKAEYLPGAVFAMNRTVLAAVRKIKDGDGTYLWEKSFQANQPFQLLGYPVATFEDMPALGTGSLSIMFGNLGVSYQIVDRIGIRVLRDPYTAKPYVKFYTTKRVGGDVVNFEAIKLMIFS